MSRFLDSICTIISVFHKLVKEDGDCSNLSRRKMKEFIQREFADVIAKPHDPQTLDKILHFLEWDGDGEIDFNEFLLLAFRVAKACYWYPRKAPGLLQRTKLTTSSKSLREPETKSRESRRQLQEEERQTCENDHHPPSEPELQRDTRVNELETLEETRSHHQKQNTRRRNEAKLSREPGESILQIEEERSQEPHNQQNSQRRRQPPGLDRRGDVQLSKGGSLQAREAGRRADEKQNQERTQREQVGDVRSCSQTCEPQPLPNRWSSRRPQEPELPAYDQNNHWPQEADRERQNQLHKPELIREERNRYLLRAVEQNELEERGDQTCEPECLETRRPHQSYIQEPLEIETKYHKNREAERDNDEQRNREKEELQYKVTNKERADQEREERDVNRRQEPVQERRIDRQRDLDLEVYERRSRETRVREEPGARTERTRDTRVVAAEADLDIKRVSRELEPRAERERRDRPRVSEELEDERRISREIQSEEPVRDRRIDRQRDLDLEVYERRSRETRVREEPGARTERTRDTRVVAAEADLHIKRVSRELEPRAERDGRDRPRVSEELEDERRISREIQSEEPVRDRRIDRQRDLDLEVYERRSRETRVREEPGARTERTRDTRVVAAEADLDIKRVSRELEPRAERDRRDRPRVSEELEDERRISREIQSEEPVRDRRIDRQRDLDLEVYERRSRETRVREEPGARTERTRDTRVVAAEADLHIKRVSRELEPRAERDRRDRPRVSEELEDERRISHEIQSEEPVRDRRIDRQRDLDLEVYERRSRETRVREEPGARTERTRDTRVVAAEADLHIKRVSRELEPRAERDRRDRPRVSEELEDERRISREIQSEEPVRDRRIDRQRDLDLEVYERRSRETRVREEPGARTERTRDTRVVAAEADLDIKRVSRELEPRAERDGRDRPRVSEELEDERRISREIQSEEPVRDRRIDRQRDLDLEVYERRSRETRVREEPGARTERTRDTRVVAAEADLDIKRVSRELEPRAERERRDRPRVSEELEDERRISREIQSEEPVRDRRIDRQRDLDLEVYERRSRETRVREEPGARTERTRDTRVVAAEADLHIKRVSRELEPRAERDRRDRPRVSEELEDERRISREIQSEEPVRDRRIDRQRDLDLEVYERRSRETRVREEPGARTERTRDTRVVAAEADLHIKRVSRELEPRAERERRDRPRVSEELEDERRISREIQSEEPVRDRRIDRQRDLDLEVYERRSRETRVREEPGARTERTRDTRVVAAEADLDIKRVSRELEPRAERERRDRPRVSEELEDERRISREIQSEEPVRDRRIDRQRDLDLEVYERRSRETRVREEPGARTERTRDTRVVAAEADLDIKRVSRELEPRAERDRRDRPRVSEELEDERRISREIQSEEPVRDRRIDRQRDLDLEVYERRSRETRVREEPGARTERTRDTRVVAAEADLDIKRVSRELEPRAERDRRDRPRVSEELEDERRISHEIQSEEPVRDRRIDRQRDLDLEVYERRSRETRVREEPGARTERTRDTRVVAAEADLHIKRVSRELEPRAERDRRDRPRVSEELEDERRISREIQSEEPVRDRRIDRQRDLDLEVYERRSRETRVREEPGARTERTRDTRVVAAEADLDIKRVSRELEPRAERERRDRPRVSEELEDERRISREIQSEEPVRDRRIDRQRDLDLEVYERRSRETRVREEPGARTERTRDTRVVAAEADLHIKRVSRELEPRAERERRDRPRVSEELEDERRISREIQSEEPVRDRRIDRQRDLDLEVYERRSRETRVREEPGARRSHRERRDRTILEIVEEEEESDILTGLQANEVELEVSESIPREPLEEGEWRNERLLREEELRESSKFQTDEEEAQRHERSLYQTVEVDNRDLCPPGQQASVTDMRVHYIPAEPDVQPEVQVVPQACDPQSIAYLVHVIQNLNNPEATTYEIICKQPHDLGQPVYVKKCYVSRQAPAVPEDRSNDPEPRPQRDERETGELEPPRRGGTSASISQENTEELSETQERTDTGVKEGAGQAFAPEPDAAKRDHYQAKTKEDRRDSQRPKMPVTEKEHQPRRDGSKATREQVQEEPESVQVWKREDREAKSCPPLPQAPGEAGATKASRPQPPRRDEASHCHEGEEHQPLEKTRQPWQEEKSKRSPRDVSDARPQREEEPLLSQGPSSTPGSQKALRRPAGEDTKAP
ncbi:trichohyalin [Apus apus]|uniref:trichohyalin n=1 Tax=Apus apus TaxID=8895 RepID=UPI0021F8BB9A|nr:trichohyalin [Apus apus]